MLATGSIAAEVVDAAVTLADHGIDAAVHVVASIVPSPSAELADLLPRFSLVLTVETHTREGGLGSLVAEVIAEHRTGTRLVRCGVKTGNNGRLGSTAYMHQVHGLDRDGLVKRVLATLAECGA
jgi:transketolase